MSILNKLSKNLFSKEKREAPVQTTEAKSGVARLNRISSEIVESLLIPEPTKSLLWITDADTSLIESTSTIRIVVGPSGVQQQENGFYSEPSLIWTKLPIEANAELAQEAMYWPSYSAFSPKERYQYLRWLSDITQPTNLSYVFLYFYGLERHLLVGEYDAAVDEIARLLKAHPKKSFIQYASRSLIVASLAKDRLDVIDRIPELLDEEINETLAVRIIKGTSMTPEDMIEISSRVGFSNKRYIKLYPQQFKAELQHQIDQYERQFGKLLSNFKLEDFKRVQSDAFANHSIPEHVRMVKVPSILDDKRFSGGIKSMLQSTHAAVKSSLASGKIDRTPTPEQTTVKKIPANINPVTAKEVDELIKKLEPDTRGVLDLHFAIQDYIETHYKRREYPSDYHESIVGCMAQIKVQDEAAKQFTLDFPDDSLPSHKGYGQLVIILEKEGRINEAIKFAEQAKRNGWSGDWDNKVNRLVKKLKNSK